MGKTYIIVGETHYNAQQTPKIEQKEPKKGCFVPKIGYICWFLVFLGAISLFLIIIFQKTL